MIVSAVRERRAERVGGHERQVVRRGVVLGEEAVGRSRQRADGEVESGRTELPLVAAGRLPVGDDAPRLAPEHVSGCAVDRGVAAPASLVAQGARVADAGDDEPVPDAVERVAVAIEPAERAERARAPEQAEGMCQRLVGQRLRERPEQHDAGEVVVGERRMAHVRGEQELGVASRRGG